MNFQYLNEQLKTYIESFQLNEMAVSKEDSGKLITEDWTLDKFIDNCVDMYDMNIDCKFYMDPKLTLNCMDPENIQSAKTEGVYLLYGNENLGIKHILDHRKGEFLQQWKVDGLMTDDKIIKYLKAFPEALAQGKQLLDFEVNSQIKEVKADRIILFHRELFYIILFKSSDVFCTFLLTMFKPKNKYKDLIFKLNRAKGIKI